MFSHFLGQGVGFATPSIGTFTSMFFAVVGLWLTSGAAFLGVFSAAKAVTVWIYLSVLTVAGGVSLAACCF